jgi:eukaryotic-like serine/threonine-protein kinase
MSLQPGQIIDEKYRIIRLVGEGGMGAVFEGENTRILRRVAIKVLNFAASSDATTVMRFEREAQAAGHIGSDHILEVLDLGVLPDDSRYMVMEFLEGETLSERIQRSGRLSGLQMHALVRQALVGLQAAHQAGIVHRDLKPDNLFLVRKKNSQEDFVKIIDFGISKFNALSGDMSMTRTGAVMGTPYYMSPEQAKGTVVDARSDVYAIGVIMYEALAGRVPFDGNTFNELMFKIVLSEPPPLQSICPDIDPRLAQIVSTAMARELDARFASAAQLMQALDAWAQGASMYPAVPSAHVAHATVPSVSAPLAQSGGGLPNTTPQFNTGGSWATSQADTPRPASHKKAAFILAGASLLVMAGVAFGAYKVVAGRSAASASSALPTTSVAVAELPQASPVPVPVAAVAEPGASAVPAVAPSLDVPAPLPSAEPSARKSRGAAPRAPLAAPARPRTPDRDFGY